MVTKVIVGKCNQNLERFDRIARSQLQFYLRLPQLLINSFQDSHVQALFILKMFIEQFHVGASCTHDTIDPCSTEAVSRELARRSRQQACASSLAITLRRLSFFCWQLHVLTTIQMKQNAGFQSPVMANSVACQKRTKTRNSIVDSHSSQHLPIKRCVNRYDRHADSRRFHLDEI